MVFVVICFICSCLYAVLNFLLIFIIRLTSWIFVPFICHFIIILWSVLKFLAFWLCVALIIYLVYDIVRTLLESRKLSTSKQNDTEQKSDCWQYKDHFYRWRDFGPSDNVAIEKLYCDAQNVQVNMILKDTYCYSR